MTTCTVPYNTANIDVQSFTNIAAKELRVLSANEHLLMAEVLLKDYNHQDSPPGFGSTDDAEILARLYDFCKVAKRHADKLSKGA